MTKSLRIALTYDSKADCLARGWTEEQASAYSSTVLINSISESLTRLNHQVVDVSHVQNLARRLVAGQAKEWDLVFNISEGVYGIAKEVQIPALLEAYRVPYTFSDAACLALAADKAKTKMILQYHGIPTSPFITVEPYERSQNGTSTIEKKLETANLQLSETTPLFVKPTMEGASNGIDHRSKVATLAKLIEITEDLHRRFPTQPLLVEKYADGREFTTSIIGTADQAKLLGIFEFRKINRGQEISDKYSSTTQVPDEEDVDFATYKVKSVATANFFELVNVTHEDSEEVREVGQIGLAAFRVLGCRDLGRIDIRSFGKGSEAKPQVLEVNSIPGLRPDNSHTPLLAEQEGLTYDQLMAEILSQAIRRYGGYKGIAAMKKARQEE